MRNLDDRALEHIARYFAALSVPVRLKILNMLRRGELNVSELTAGTGCTQANVSKHLALLMQHGIVDRTSRGASAYYRIADSGIYALCEVVCGHIENHFTKQMNIGRMFSESIQLTDARPVRRQRRE